MDYGLKGRVALVAASSKGLGRAVAQALADEGASLAICARNAGELEAAASELRQAGAPDVLAVPVDLSSKDDLDRLLDQTLSHFGQVDVLFTNSGGPPAGYFWDVSDEDWLAAFEMMMMSAVWLIRGVLPGMRKRGWGRIICLTSMSAVQPNDSLILSTAIRPGIHGMAKSLANTLAPEGITVNCVVPGPFETDRITDLSQARAEREGIPLEEALAAWSERNAVGRIGRVEEFGAAVAFLASEQAAYITGSSLRLDGGEFPGLL